ncbi:MTAP family purine nucleoside phosphorylase [Syntrophomonas erecta]
MNIPASELALIGGSSTLSIEMPEDLNLDYVNIIEKDLTFTTPFGTSPAFKLLELTGAEGTRRVLTCRMHGWRSGVTRADASRQIFWVFKQAGVKRILVEGGVGAINHLLRTRDLVIAHDYMDFSVRKDVGLEAKHLLVMREALCPEMRRSLVKHLENHWKGRVFDRGIYVNTDGRHFESPAEVNLFKIAGGDIVGQSICPEVYLAREIGACYAGIYLVVNYAEGIVAPWRHEELADIFYNESCMLGGLMLEFLRDLPTRQDCTCPSLRKETLLKEVYHKEG